MKVLTRINAAFNALETALVILLMRNLFHGGFVWGDILLRHLVLWLGFLGGALATSHQRHIHIDALAHFLPARGRSAVAVFTNLFGAAICALLLAASVTFIGGEMDARSTVFEGVPAWYTELIIPAGFGLHILHFLIRSGMNAVEALRPGEAR